MSKWDKLIARICSLSKDLRFNELRKVLESYGYEMNAPRSGSSPLYVQKAGLYADYCTEARTSQESICRNGKADCRRRGEE